MKHFPDPDPQPLHEVLAEEWVSAVHYLKASPLTAVNAAFAVFTIACDTVGADYLRTFMDLLQLNPSLPGSHRTIRLEPKHNTDPHTDGDKTSGQ